MAWNATVISSKVKESAERFGTHNPQQISQLLFSLSNAEENDVFNGLLRLFLDTDPKVQILSGELLYEISPKPPADIKEQIHSLLEHYELSASHLPYYLVKALGKDTSLAMLSELSSLDLNQRQQRALNTFIFWTKGYEKDKFKNTC